jgi:hypothetical protein
LLDMVSDGQTGKIWCDEEKAFAAVKDGEEPTSEANRGDAGREGHTR